MDAATLHSPADDACVLCALVGALLAALVVAVLVKFMLFAPPRFATLPLDETCSLSGGVCTVSLPGGGRLEFTLAPRPVPLLKPLNLELRVEGSRARAVEVDFTGVNVPMAFNRAHLSAADAGRYDGQTTLPLCSSGRMVWQAMVRLEDGERTIYAPFRFETGAA